MQAMSILILGRNAGMMQQVLAFLQQEGFANTKGVLSNEEVQTALLTRQYNVLIIGGGVDTETRNMIKQLIADKRIDIKLVEHFGNPATLVAEIKTAVTQ